MQRFIRLHQFETRMTIIGVLSTIISIVMLIGLLDTVDTISNIVAIFGIWYLVMVFLHSIFNDYLDRMKNKILNE